MLGEFDQIAQIMAPLADSAKGAFALTDDAAVFSCPSSHEIVVTTDTLIADVHFFADDPADEIAKKLLGVNLSDLASMGARPLHYTLNASYPDTITTEWVKSFADGLCHMQNQYGIVLLGGDTTRTAGPLTLSLTAFGTVLKGKALRRKTSRAGDLICVSGTIGDGALGLKVAQDELKDPSGYLLRRYRKPQPRTELGQALVGIATACMDISDGLLNDFAHMKVGGDIQLDKIPLSSAAKNATIQDSSLISAVLNGGDDYELLFTINPDDVDKVEIIAEKTKTKITIIGSISEKTGIRVHQSNDELLADIPSGYRHF